MRTFVFTTSLVFIGFLAYMTIAVAARGILTPIVLVALAVLGLLATGVIGAMLHNPKR